jgi:hypothetical protein
VIHNDLPGPATVNVEPEGVFLSLGSGEEVAVVDEYTSHPVTVRLGETAGGAPVISIWPGDGEVRVERGGVNVLEGRVADAPPAPSRGAGVPKTAASS